MSGTIISTSHLPQQISAYDLVAVLGSKQPTRGDQHDYNNEVAELARQVQVGFQASDDQLAQLGAIPPSPDALTRQVAQEFRGDWTTAMLLLGGAPLFGNQRKILAVSEQTVNQARQICMQYGIPLDSAVTGLQEASQLLARRR